MSPGPGRGAHPLLHATGLALLSFVFGLAAAADEVPSLLLVTLDTTRADHLAPYGAADAGTPHLAALARRGVLFERAYAATPVTLPSHASILTGLDPPRHGVRDNGIHHLPPETPTLAALLRGEGYATAAFVSAAVLERRYGLDSGFAHYDDDLSAGRPKALLMVAERPARATVDAALAWLEDLPPKAPFFLWVHLFDPHAPYEPPPPFDRRFAERPYDGEIAYVDAELGRLLESERIAGPSPVVISVIGDHGEGLGEHGEETHGMLAYDATLRVPWILRAPGNRLGLRIAAPVSQTDLLPTVLELLGLAALGTRLELDGRSQAPVILGRDDGRAPGRALYAETFVPYYAYGWARLRTLRRLGWKLIDGPDPELYDLHRDPGETRSLYTEEPQRAAELRRFLEAISPDAAPSPALPIDDAAAARLRSLGYAAGGPRPERRGPPADPKRMMGVHRAMTRAKQLLLERRLEEAVEALREVLRRDETNLDAIQSLGVALGELGQTEAALRAARRGLELAPDDVEMHLTLASLERDRGRLERALAAVDAALALDPRALDTRLERAAVLLDAGRRGEARAELERALELAPEDPRASVAYAEGVEIPDGELGPAERRLETAVRREPFLVRGWLALGRLHRLAGRPERAEAAYRQGLSRQPLDRSLLTALGSLLADAGAEEGEALLRRAIDLPGRPPEEALIALGDALRGRGEHDEARTLYERVLATSSGATYARGHALLFLGRPEEAAVVFRAVLEDDPQEARAHDGLAGTSLDRREWVAAEQHARRSLELAPALVSAWNSLAIAVEEQGRYAEAREAYGRALELEPRFWNARFNRGLLLRRLGRFAEAAADFERVLEQLPGHAKSHYELGVLYGGHLRRPELARAHLEAALAAEPDHPRAETIRRLLSGLPR